MNGLGMRDIRFYFDQHLTQGIRDHYPITASIRFNDNR